MVGFDPTFMSAIAAMLGMASILVWLLVRRLQKRIWLPTMRIIDHETRKLPKLRFRFPHWIPFLAFLMASLCIIIFTFKPTRTLVSTVNSHDAHFHFFFDMSPSTSADLTIDQYADASVQLWDALSRGARITVSTSHSLTTFQPNSSQELRDTIRRLGFHRAGLRLGTALKALMGRMGKLDRIIVVSDGDLHTWQDFNWQFLQRDTDVFWYDVSAESSTLDNVFISRAQYVTSPDAGLAEWDIDLARDQWQRAVAGTIRAQWNGINLAQERWSLPKEYGRSTVRLSWPVNKIEAALYERNRSVPLVLTIEVDGGDRLLIDNDRRFFLRGLKRSGVLIAAPSGELALEDSSHHMNIALSTLGFDMKRWDHVRNKDPEIESGHFWAIVAGRGDDVDSFCPRSLTEGRFDGRMKMLEAPPIVWLMPGSLEMNYEELCKCYSRLVLKKKFRDRDPSFCAESQTRAGWLEMLASTGAKQIGGAVDDASQAIARHFKDEISGMEVLAFSIPLNPSLRTGLSYGKLPSLIQSLLQWQKLYGPAQSDKDDWPTIEDIAERVWRDTEIPHSELSNVPQGESLLTHMDQNLMPPRWSRQILLNSLNSIANRETKDPFPWILTLSFTVIFAMLFEVTLSSYQRIRKRILRKWIKASAVLFAIGFLGISEVADAQVRITSIGFVRNETVGNLALEVSSRTSIDLYKSLIDTNRLTPLSLSEPWMWVRSLSEIREGKRLRRDVVNWIRKGGLLIIENDINSNDLTELTRDSFELRDEKQGWNPIPPDHELMRSFYLLNSLPSCRESVWRGYHFDGRLAIIAIPYPFLNGLYDVPKETGCGHRYDVEQSTRIFVNILMVALATDYKKDQIHLPEILKRLR